MTKEKPEHRALDFKWHLAGDNPAVATTEMEFALMRTFESFGRWQSECLVAVSGITLSGPENALLHVIRMNDRAKSAKELARLLNRDDIPNIQYSLRKMIADGFVEKQGSSRTGVTYEATDLGCEVTDRYSEIRRKLLVEEIQSLPEFVERLQSAARTLTILSGIYEEASRIVATHR
ncbi:winged helix DNA-binding protein [Celeribacter halophilus]|uniref:winged helix DNA-binding protein n=1 Tax=Celeribacter halophilus TaxID=576117 RepID=UPI0026E33945|nr:winged helix DNA-binding protein [Celeribacter halophilus]MDO6724933.1 winged helix DNA-binding protein [Celeribacter halophilus]